MWAGVECFNFLFYLSFTQVERVIASNQGSAPSDRSRKFSFAKFACTVPAGSRILPPRSRVHLLCGWRMLFSNVVNVHAGLEGSGAIAGSDYCLLPFHFKSRVRRFPVPALPRSLAVELVVGWAENSNLGRIFEVPVEQKRLRENIRTSTNSSFHARKNQNSKNNSRGAGSGSGILMHKLHKMLTKIMYLCKFWIQVDHSST